MNEKVKLEITCSLCLEVFKDPIILNCCHNFCLNCATNLLTYSGGLTIRCPLCRSSSQIPTVNGIPQFKKNLTLCNLIDQLTEKPEPKHKQCDNCEDEWAIVTCKDCGEDLCTLCTSSIHARGRRRAHRVVQIGTVVSYKCDIHHREMDFLCLQDQALICVDCLTKGGHICHQAVAVQQSMKKSYHFRKETKYSASSTDSLMSPMERSLVRSFSSMSPHLHHTSTSDFDSLPDTIPPFFRSRSDDLLIPVRRNREGGDSKEDLVIGGPSKQARTESKEIKSEHGINIEAKFLATSSSDERLRSEEKLSIQAFWKNISEEEVEWHILEKEIVEHFNQHALQHAKSYRSLSKEDLHAIRAQLEEGKKGEKINFNAVKKRWHWFTTLERIVSKIGFVWWQEEPRLCQGIVSRYTSEQMLKNQLKGTFILRFSESQPGFIAVDYVHSRRGVVHTLIDANGSRFKSFERVHDRNVEREYDTLPELIMSLSFFRYVYPNVNKQDVFTR